MKRWLIVSAGIAIGAAAFYLLAAAGPPPLDDIDDGSRKRLERVLHDSDARRNR